MKKQTNLVSMKLLRIFAVILISLVSCETFAQVFIKPNNSYGLEYNRMKLDSALVLPSDTVHNKIVGSIAILNEVAYIKNIFAWEPLSTGGGGGGGSETFEDVLNNGPDLTANHISNGGANDFYWQNYGTYTIDAQTLAVPYLAIPSGNTDKFISTDEFGNLITKQIQLPTDSSGQVDITHDFQRSLDDGNQLRHDDTVKGNSYAFLWDKIHHFSVMSGATFEFPYGNHSQIFLDSLSSYYYSQDTTGRSQVWASPDYADIESSDSAGNNSYYKAWKDGGLHSFASGNDTIESPQIILSNAAYHNSDKTKFLTTDANGALGFSDGNAVSTGDVTWSVLDILNTPPGSPVSGDQYLVGTSGTGAWSGHNNEIATWNGSSWTFNTATTGDLLYNDDTNNSGDNGVYKWNGTAWVRIGKLPWLVGLNRGLLNPKFGTFNNTGLGIYTNNTERIDISNAGAIKFNAYGSGTNTGTATHNLAVDASGNVIETTGGSSTDTVNVSNPISQGLDTTHWVDATPYINAAINAFRFSVGKLKLYLPHGDYYISVSALRSGSQTNHQGIQTIDNLEIYGDGVGKTRLHAIGNTTGDTSNTNWYPVINGMYRSNVKVHDLSIDGNQDSIAIYNSDPYVNTTGHNDSSKHYSVQGIYFKDGDNNQVFNVEVDSCQGFGIDFYNVTRGYVRNSRFRFNGNGAIGFTGRDDSKITTGGAYDNICDSNNSDNIRVVSCGEGIAIVHNQLSNAKNVTSSNAFAGLWVDRTRGVYAAYNKVFGNSGYGLDFGGGDSSTTGGARMEYNNVYQNGNGAIVSLGNSVIHGNYLHDNGKTPAGVTDTHSNYNAAAIVVSASPNMVITDNIAYDSVSGTQTYFIKKWGGSPTPAFGFMGSVVNNNRIFTVADTSHAYNGNNGRNSIIYNVITNSSNNIIPPASDSMVLGLVNGLPQWITRGASGGSTPSLTSTQIAYGNGSNLMTSDANMTWTSGSKLMTLDNPGIANTSTNSLLLKNSTAATSGVTAQFSPSLIFSGSAWKSNSTAASQTMNWKMEDRPITGAAAATSTFALSRSNAGGGYVDMLTIGSNTVFQIPTNGVIFPTFELDGAMSIGTSPSTVQALTVNTSNVQGTTQNVALFAGNIATTSAGSALAGVLSQPVASSTAPNASANFAGVYGQMRTSTTNYTQAPATFGGVTGFADYSNVGSAAFPIIYGTRGIVNLSTGVTKDATKGYGLWSTLSANAATPSGRVVYYAGLRIDSVDNTNFTYAKPFAIDARGTNSYSFVASSGFLIGNYHNSGNDTATSTLDVNGSFANAYTSTAVDYTATANDCVIEVTATGKTVTLPTAVGCTGRKYVVKLTASGSGTVATTSSQNIDASTTYSLSAQYKYVEVVSNNVGWIIVASN